MTPGWYLRKLTVQEPPLEGADVEAVQRKVHARELGYGPITAAKVRGWQWLHNVETTGVVDPDTAKKLGE